MSRFLSVHITRLSDAVFRWLPASREDWLQVDAAHQPCSFRQSLCFFHCSLSSFSVTFILDPLCLCIKPSPYSLLSVRTPDHRGRSGFWLSLAQQQTCSVATLHLEFCSFLCFLQQCLAGLSPIYFPYLSVSRIFKITAAQFEGEALQCESCFKDTVWDGGSPCFSPGQSSRAHGCCSILLVTETGSPFAERLTWLL